MRNILLAVLISNLYSCTSYNNKYTELYGNAQGTTYQIKYRGGTGYSNQITAILGEIDSSLSVYNKNSIISRFNNSDTGIVAGKHLINVYNASVIINRQTGGYFDITVAPLTELWGFIPGKKAPPDSSVTSSLMKVIGMDKLWLENDRLIKKMPQLRIDVNAVAQGYTVDCIAEFLDSENIGDYMVELGGEVRTKGLNEKGEKWRIGIDKPVENQRELNAVFLVSGKSVATSGSYRKFVLKDGIRYSHTINPKTGAPTFHNLLSVTVVAENCAYADGVATGIMAMGLEAGKDFVLKNKDIDAYFIYSGNNGSLQEWKSSGINNIISYKNKIK